MPSLFLLVSYCLGDALLAIRDDVPVMAFVYFAAIWLVCLTYAEWKWGITFCNRPIEAITGLFTVLKMVVFIFTPVDNAYLIIAKGIYSNSITLTIPLFFCCPAILKKALLHPWAIGGVAWQSIAFVSIARLPWASKDRRLLDFSMLGAATAISHLLAGVPIVEGYSSPHTGRLRALMTDFGGNAFTLVSVRWLTICRADPNATTKEGETVLMYAVSRNEVEIVNYLCKLKPVRENVDRANESNCTPLHIAKDPVIARLLLEAGADPGKLNDAGRTPFMTTTGEVRELLSAEPWCTPWQSFVKKLPGFPEDAQLFNSLWDESLKEEDQEERLSIVVKDCIMPLIKENSQKPLPTHLMRCLELALEATECPKFQWSSLAPCHHYQRTADGPLFLHQRGAEYESAVLNAAKGFENDLSVEHQKLQADEAGRKLWAISSKVERLHQNATRFPWGEREWLSQIVAEGVPDWVTKRSLVGAVTALVEVEAILSASELADLLLGQHRWFHGKAYMQYFESCEDDIFWLSLYVLSDIGKTELLYSDIHSAFTKAINAPSGISFTGAGPKRFKRIMEKVVDYCGNLKDFFQKGAYKGKYTAFNNEGLPTKDINGKTLSLAEEKELQNILYMQKVHCAAEVVDKVRNQFTCFSGSHLVAMVERFDNLDRVLVKVRPGVQFRLTSIQRRNGFPKPGQGGWADIKYWALVEQMFWNKDSTTADSLQVGYALVAETQLVLDSYVRVKKKMHIVYQASRGDYDTRAEEMEREASSSPRHSKVKSSLSVSRSFSKSSNSIQAKSAECQVVPVLPGMVPESSNV